MITFVTQQESGMGDKILQEGPKWKWKLQAGRLGKEEKKQ